MRKRLLFSKNLQHSSVLSHFFLKYSKCLNQSNIPGNSNYSCFKFPSKIKKYLNSKVKDQIIAVWSSNDFIEIPTLVC